MYPAKHNIQRYKKHFVVATLIYATQIHAPITLRMCLICLTSCATISRWLFSTAPGNRTPGTQDRKDYAPLASPLPHRPFVPMYDHGLLAGTWDMTCGHTWLDLDPLLIRGNR